jgi:hypothetical protein
VRFDGVDDHLVTDYYRNVLFTYHDVTMFVVFKTSGPVEARGLISQGMTSLGVNPDKGGSLIYSSMFQSSFTGKSDSAGIRTIRPGAIKPDTWTLAEMVRSGSQSRESKLFINGKQDDDGAGVPYHQVNADHAVIGSMPRNQGMWKGEIAEILIYGDALSDADRGKVRNYLVQKYGLRD